MLEFKKLEIPKTKLHCCPFTFLNPKSKAPVFRNPPHVKVHVLCTNMCKARQGYINITHLFISYSYRYYALSRGPHYKLHTRLVVWSKVRIRNEIIIYLSLPSTWVTPEKRWASSPSPKALKFRLGMEWKRNGMKNKVLARGHTQLSKVSKYSRLWTNLPISFFKGHSERTKKPGKNKNVEGTLSGGIQKIKDSGKNCMST